MTAPMQDLIIRNDRAGVRWLTLNRPEARNALSMPLMVALAAALDAAEGDASVAVVVIAGAGPAFCAGHDLREVRGLAGHEARADLFAACSRLMLRVGELSKPVIARVHGVATAAGCQLVASCDLALAAEDARFATPGVAIGLFCSTPAVALSRAVGRKAAMEMLLTGDMISAARAVEIGLINRTVPREGEAPSLGAPSLGALDREVQKLGEAIATRSGAVIALGKQAFRRQAAMGIEDAYFHASLAMARNLDMVDAAEGIDAFLEKRAPVWRGR